MGNCSDGDREDHKRVKAVMAEKPPDISETEKISHNEIKLVEHISNNFIENSTLLLAKNDKVFVTKTLILIAVVQTALMSNLVKYQRNLSKIIFTWIRRS